MLKSKIFANPSDEVIFECAFDELMKQIRGEDFVDISTGKVKCERLEVRSD